MRLPCSTSTGAYPSTVNFGIHPPDQADGGQTRVRRGSDRGQTGVRPGSDPFCPLFALRGVLSSNRWNQILTERAPEIVAGRESPVLARRRVVDVCRPRIDDRLALAIDVPRH